MTPIIAFLDMFLAVGGYKGGKSFTSDPSGQDLHMSTDMLARVPLVKSYLLPGIFLLIAFALSGTVAAIATIYKYPWAQEFNMVLGLTLMGWIIAEWIWIKDRSWLQVVYFLTGMALVILPLI